MLPDAVREALGGPAQLPGSPPRRSLPGSGSSAGGGGGGDSGGGGGGANEAASPRVSSSSSGVGGASSSNGGAAAAGASGGGGVVKVQTPRDLPGVMELPRAGELLSTMRRRIEALNGPAMARLKL